MKVAAYCRVSTGSDEQLNSLKNQSEFFISYANKMNYELVKIYADRGLSGKNASNRPQFQKMLEDSCSGQFDMLLVKDISRFARNTVDFLTGIRHLKLNGVEIRFLSSNQTVLGESEFVLTLFAALAQEESCNLSKKIIFGKKQGAKKGRVPSCVYGYDRGRNFAVSVNKSEAETVKLIFDMYANRNMGIRKIAASLNERGISTKRGMEWGFKTVRRMLTNEIYIGKIVNNKSSTTDFLSGTRAVNPCEEWIVNYDERLRIIPDSLFLKAGNRLNAVTHRSG